MKLINLIGIITIICNCGCNKLTLAANLYNKFNYTVDNGNKNEELFPVAIIHMNDFHARFEETNEESTPCKPGQKCIGGYARAITVVKQLLDQRKQQHPIYLNAGDNFQGTIWYNVGGWNVTSYFLNLLKADAITLGNHEFDQEIEGVVPFLNSIESPMIVSNIDDRLEPTMQGKYRKSIIIDKYDRKIGVIGVILSTTDQIAATGKLKFLNESLTVRNEAAELKKQGVDIIIVLSHCGLDVDYIIAEHAGPDIDVIVGGHTHTFMYNGENPPGPDTPQDTYPAVVTQELGHKVLIVQASSYTKYIGDLTVYFDKNGEVVSWEGNPIYLNSSITPDPVILNALQPWKKFIDQEGSRVIGSTKVTLSRDDCPLKECNIGNFITDAFVNSYVQFAGEHEWTSASVAVINIGGIRTTLSQGALTIADLVTTLPFENTIDSLELRGDHLVEMLEYSVNKTWPGDSFIGANMLQVSGLNIVYNVTNPIGHRVVSVKVLCNECNVPEYFPLDSSKMYRIIAPTFLVNGGDGFDVIKQNGVNYRVGPVDINSLISYVKRMSPITTGTNGRITMLT